MKISNYETLNGGCVRSKNKFKTKKQEVKLAHYGYKFKLLHTGSPIAHTSIEDFAKPEDWIFLVKTS